MTATVPDLSTAIAAQITTIDKVRTLDYLGDTFSPPVAVVAIHDAVRESFGNPGEWRYTFTVLLVVSKVDDRAGMAALEGYMSTTGATSIRAALEQDQTLSGKASSLWVTHIGPPTSMAIGTSGVVYATCPFSVEVLG